MIAAGLVERGLRMVVGADFRLVGEVERVRIECQGGAIPEHRKDNEDCQYTPQHLTFAGQPVQDDAPQPAISRFR
ncbi:MAG: hypothetical protein WBG92_05855 [Thiohalocapsa sp.]